MLMVLM